MALNATYIVEPQKETQKETQNVFVSRFSSNPMVEYKNK